MTPTLMTYSLAAIALLVLIAGLVKRASRAPWWLSAVCFLCAALSAYYDNFWSMVALFVLGVAALTRGFDWVDPGWRLRFGVVFAAAFLALLSLWPTVSGATGGKLPCPDYISERVDFRLVAGLDLRGGLRLVYTVDADEAIEDRRDRLYEDMRVTLAKLLELHDGDESPSEEVYAKLRERLTLTRPKTDVRAIELRLQSASDSSKVDTRFLEQFRSDLTFALSADQTSYDFRLRSSTENQIRESAVAQAREIILRRVDELGLREAAVSTRGDDIIVEVPGQDEASFERIREIISQTARLEFKLLDDETDVFGPMRDGSESTSFPDGMTFEQETVSVGQDEDENLIRQPVTYAYLALGEEESAREGLNRLREWGDNLSLPPDRELGYQIEFETDAATQRSREVGVRTYLLRSRAEITGDLIRDAFAQPDTSQNSLGGWYVAIRFTDAGGAIFERITGANIKRRFAIILDGRVESAPVIQSRIAGGNASITMGSGDPERQLQDSRKLELVLRSGALPAPITPTNEQHIGPSLGQDSIRLGVRGAAFGGLLVLAFMILYYRRAGIIADIAVGLNLLILLAILASFGASMTLPGIAGLALTTGMSVDSNVLINERIREELRQGRSPRAAVELGYGKALSAILDGQLTTLISAVVLAQFGTGPVKGFAVTLMVGVASSIFTGVVVSRVLFDLWVRGLGRSAKLDMG